MTRSECGGSMDQPAMVQWTSGLKMATHAGSPRRATQRLLAIHPRYRQSNSGGLALRLERQSQREQVLFALVGRREESRLDPN